MSLSIYVSLYLSTHSSFLTLLSLTCDVVPVRAVGCRGRGAGESLHNVRAHVQLGRGHPGGDALHLGYGWVGLDVERDVR
jgi:hypothetical protein